jgi:hypothetical protein
MTSRPCFVLIIEPEKHVVDPIRALRRALKTLLRSYGLKAISVERQQQERKPMLIMHMPETFKIGDTAACRINGEPAQLTWRSADTLVIGADDARYIVRTHLEDGLRCFICGDADDRQHYVEYVPGPGFIVFSKGNAS